MITRSARYDLAKLAWGLLAVGVPVLVYAEGLPPHVPPSRLPGGPVQAVPVGIALALLGGVVVTVRKTMAWKAAGRRADLAPEGSGGLYRKPDLAGSVHGRPVRARAVTLHTGAGASSRQGTTHTRVEAVLDGDAAVGLVVTPAAGGRTSRMTRRFAVDTGDASVRDDELAAVGPEAVAREVLSGRSREALLALEEPTLVFAGDAADALADTLGDAGSSLGDSLLERSAAAHVPDDPGTVTVEKRGLVLDGDALARRAEAVAAVAETFEDATGGD